MELPGLGDKPIPQRFTAVGGRQFNASAPVTDIAPHLKENDLQDFDVVSMATFNYRATLYRPEPDMLVIVPEDRVHRIWFRCTAK